MDYLQSIKYFPSFQARVTNRKTNIIVTDLLKPFLGNGTVNSFQRATMELCLSGLLILLVAR
jgi:hypothetical protein